MPRKSITFLSAVLIIGSLTLNSCTSVESVTISNISQADSTKKTKVEVVFDGEVDKTQIADFIESFGTAVAEGETIIIVTPSTTPTATPPRRATATSTRTPSATATARPTLTPTTDPTDLADADRSALWVLLLNDSGTGQYLSVYADPAFDVNTFGLTVIVDGRSFCNPEDIYGDEGALEMSCASLQRAHTSVQNVSARTENRALRCVKNKHSDAERTVFACAWRQ